MRLPQCPPCTKHTASKVAHTDSCRPSIFSCLRPPPDSSLGAPLDQATPENKATSSSKWPEERSQASAVSGKSLRRVATPEPSCGLTAERQPWDSSAGYSEQGTATGNVGLAQWVDIAGRAGNSQLQETDLCSSPNSSKCHHTTILGWGGGVLGPDFCPPRLHGWS